MCFRLATLDRVLRERYGAILTDNQDDPTLREKEIIALVAQGYTDKQISSKLEISERTVQTHISNICQKLAALNRPHAVKRAVEQGWLVK